MFSHILICFLSRNNVNWVRAFIFYVRPLVEYVSTVWSPSDIALIDVFESVQRRFTKRLPGFSNMSYADRLTLTEILVWSTWATHVKPLWKCMWNTYETDVNHPWICLFHMCYWNFPCENICVSHVFSHGKFHMWNFTCEIVTCEKSHEKFSHVTFPMWKSHMWIFPCEISHVTFPMWNFTCEISHKTFHMWNITCEKSHVKFHTRNITCEISYVIFHMWNFPCEIPQMKSHVKVVTWESFSHVIFQIRQ